MTAATGGTWPPPPAPPWTRPPRGSGTARCRPPSAAARYQLTRAKHGPTPAGVSASEAWQDMRSRPVRTALAAGAVTLAAATVGAPVVAGAAGLVLGRRALTARRDTAHQRSQELDSEVLDICAQHRSEAADPHRPDGTTALLGLTRNGRPMWAAEAMHVGWR